MQEEWVSAKMPAVNKDSTYRIPLTLSDRLKAERDRLVKSKRRVHELKTWPEFYEEVASGRKPFEIRLNDRDFREGDVLYLRKYHPDTRVYSGQYCYREVTYLTDWGQKPNHVVMGLKQTPPFDNEEIDKEIARLDEQIRVVEAVEKGAEWEQYHCSDGKHEIFEWFQPADQCVARLDQVIKLGGKIRLKPIPPTPQTIPWTLESHPDVVCLKHKERPRAHVVVQQWDVNGCDIPGVGWRSYKELNNHWLQRNGEPAGEKVTV